MGLEHYPNIRRKSSSGPQRHSRINSWNGAIGQSSFSNIVLCSFRFFQISIAYSKATTRERENVGPGPQILPANMNGDQIVEEKRALNPRIALEYAPDNSQQLSLLFPPSASMIPKQRRRNFVPRSVITLCFNYALLLFFWQLKPQRRQDTRAMMKSIVLDIQNHRHHRRTR